MLILAIIIVHSKNCFLCDYCVQFRIWRLNYQNAVATNTDNAVINVIVDVVIDVVVVVIHVIINMMTLWLKWYEFFASIARSYYKLHWVEQLSLTSSLSLSNIVIEIVIDIIIDVINDVVIDIMTLSLKSGWIFCKYSLQTLQITLSVTVVNNGVVGVVKSHNWCSHWRHYWCCHWHIF